jgi:hypothetical protein
MKDVWLKEVGDLTLPIYPKEIEWLETKNHIRVAARKEAEELKRRRK